MNFAKLEHYIYMVDLLGCTGHPIYGTGLQVLFSHLIQFFLGWDRQPSAGFNFGAVNFACIFQC
jgi:hypothetical protein